MSAVMLTSMALVGLDCGIDGFYGLNGGLDSGLDVGFDGGDLDVAHDGADDSGLEVGGDGGIDGGNVRLLQFFWSLGQFQSRTTQILMFI